MIKEMLNLKQVKYHKCRLCECGFQLHNGIEQEFITEKNKTVKQFICDSCLDTIINCDKADEWY